MRAALRLLCVTAAAAIIAVALPQAASAAWSAETGSAGPARSAATTMPSGNQPTATVATQAGSTVDVSWAASSGGAPVAGYEVRSYDATTGTPRTVGDSCAGVVAGTSCSETSVPDGSWRYSVIPRQQAWIGAESPLSEPVTVDSSFPTPTGLTLLDAGGTVTPRTDEVRITFSEALNVSSVCSAWSGTGDQALGGSGVVVTITESLVNDVLTVAAGACTLHIGSVATGGDYVLTTSTFSGATAATESRVTWTAATRVLTIHLGSLTSGILQVVPQATATATYTPDAAITDLGGNPVVTTPFNATAQRF
jgi:hypothetical protein